MSDPTTADPERPTRHDYSDVRAVVRCVQALVRVIPYGESHVIDDVAVSIATLAALTEEAITRVEAQQAEIARLTQEREELRRQWADQTPELQAFREEFAARVAAESTVQAREAAIARVVQAMRQLKSFWNTSGGNMEPMLPDKLDTLWGWFARREVLPLIDELEALTSASPQEPK